MKKDNLLGMTFGKLTVIKETTSDNGLARWICKCECGNISRVYSSNLKRGKSKSCNKCNKGRIFNYNKTPRGCAFRLMQNAKHRANKNKLEYSLHIFDIEKRLNKGCCEVTGIQFEFVQNKRHPFAPSIDRIDPKKGYTPDNIQIVCWVYNAAKGDNTHEDVLKLSRALINKLVFRSKNAV